MYELGHVRRGWQILRVIGEANGIYMWLCKRECCGLTSVKSSGSPKWAKGCKCPVPDYRDLRGKEFGGWTVLDLAPCRKDRRKVWSCERVCCGLQGEFTTSDLQLGRTPKRCKCGSTTGVEVFGVPMSAQDFADFLECSVHTVYLYLRKGLSVEEIVRKLGDK